MRRGAFGLSSLTTYRLAYANQYVKRILIFFQAPQFLRIYEDSLWPLASVPPLCYAQSTKSCPPPLARALFGGMSMQAVHLSGGALTLGLAAALLCAGCAPLPSASQGSSAPQVSTVSASLSQVSSLRGALDRLEPEADCLVLASGGEYYRFERNGVDVSGLIPGDPVTVTYTGALDPEEGTVSAVLLSITRDTL